MLSLSCVVKHAVLQHLVSLCDDLHPQYPNIAWGPPGEAAGGQPTPSILHILSQHWL